MGSTGVYAQKKDGVQRFPRRLGKLGFSLDAPTENAKQSELYLPVDSPRAKKKGEGASRKRQTQIPPFNGKAIIQLEELE